MGMFYAEGGSTDKYNLCSVKINILTRAETDVCVCVCVCHRRLFFINFGASVRSQPWFLLNLFEFVNHPAFRYCTNIVVK